MPTKKTVKKNIDVQSKYERIFDSSPSGERVNSTELIDPVIEAKIYEKCDSRSEYIELLYESIKTNITNINPKKSYYENFEELYSSEKEQYLETLRINNTKPEAVKGLKPCKGSPGYPCGCDEFYIWSAQTRSADEGTTNFEKCKKCGKRRHGE